jgi:hypothetical protein
MPPIVIETAYDVPHGSRRMAAVILAQSWTVPRSIAATMAYTARSQPVGRVGVDVAEAETHSSSTCRSRASARA